MTECYIIILNILNRRKIFYCVERKKKNKNAGGKNTVLTAGEDFCFGQTEKVFRNKSDIISEK